MSEPKALPGAMQQGMQAAVARAGYHRDVSRELLPGLTQTQAAPVAASPAGYHDI